MPRRPPIVIEGATPEIDYEAVRAEEEALRNSRPSPAPSPGIPLVTSLSDYLQLENISCVDAEGQVFERYDRLYVRKDIERGDNKNQKDFTPYAGAVYFEAQGLFLPSFALSCAIVAALYLQKNDPALNAVLMQYKDKDNGDGWHAQNTLINYATEEVVHYPTADDFAQAATVNSAHPRRALPFSKTTLQYGLLENAIRDPASARYVRQLTGLADPSVLVEIGKYFQKTAKLWYPWTAQGGATFTETRAAWLGCIHDDFNLSSYNDLNRASAARGVRRESVGEMPGGHAL